jgi:hypothetical protein
MAFLKISGQIASFAHVMEEKYSQVSDLTVVHADGNKTIISGLYLRTDMLLHLQHVQADGEHVELHIDRRPKMVGRHQLFGMKTPNVAMLDERDPRLSWLAIPLVVALISGIVCALILGPIGFLMGLVLAQIFCFKSFPAFYPLSAIQMIWLLANRTDRRKSFYGDAAETARTKALEPASI